MVKDKIKNSEDMAHKDVLEVYILHRLMVKGKLDKHSVTAAIFWEIDVSWRELVPF